MTHVQAQVKASIPNYVQGRCFHLKDCYNIIFLLLRGQMPDEAKFTKWTEKSAKMKAICLISWHQGRTSLKDTPEF